MTTSRYSRQELVLGKKAQKKLEQSTVAVVGLGALGSVAAELLCRAGVKLILLDRDVVERTNLQRQVLYTEEEIGQPKAQAAHDRLKAINSTVTLTSEVTDINHNNIHHLLRPADLVLDCTDNLYTRYLIDEYAEQQKKPWVYGGAIMDRGNVMTITHSTARLCDLFSSTREGETCDTVGILSTASALVATLQVNEAIKVLTGTFKEQSLIHFNLSTLSVTKVKGPKRGKAKTAFPYLEGKKEPQIIRYQCAGLYQFYKENLDLAAIKKTLKKVGKVRGGKDHLFFENLSVFSNGRIFVKAKNEGRAKAIISKYIGM